MRMWDVVLDALIDTLKILPILLIVNFFIEYFEIKASNKIYNSKFLNGKLSPLFASGVGLIPQCGFSVVASNLYATKKIAMGTLLAVFLTTSDEAIPIMLGGGAKSAFMLLPLLGGKLVLAIIVGYLVNLISGQVAKKQAAKLEIKNVNPAVTQTVLVAEDNSENVDDKKENAHEHNNQEDSTIGCHHHKIGKDAEKTKWFIHPIVHSLIVSLYIFVVTLAFGLLIYYVGETRITSFITSTKLFAPFLVGLVGLIPNCASSVIIAQSFVGGIISFGAAFAGLCANAGIGVVVLFKQNKNIKQNLLILSLLYIISTIVGFLIDLIF